jgi:hypothetical protein
VAAVVAAFAVVAAPQWTPPAAATDAERPISPSAPDRQVNAAFRLGGKTVAQTFAYDNTMNVLYTSQVDSNRNAEKQGDLLVTKICNAGTSKRYGTVHLRNFGHSTSIGVEPTDPSPRAKRRSCGAKPKNAYLWIEVDSTPDYGGRGAGRKLARILFGAGQTYTYADGAITVTTAKGAKVATTAQVFDLLPGAIRLAPAYDPTTDRLLVHYNADGAWHYALYDRSAILQHGRDAPDLIGPDMVPPAVSESDLTKKEYLQGIALHAGWIYTLVGYRDLPITRITAFRTDGSAASSATVSASVHRILLRKYRTYEPEGLAFRILADGTARLRWGMSVGRSGISNGAFNRKLVILEKATG